MSINESLFTPLTIPTPQGMNTPRIRGLINFLARRSDVYLEVGSFKGASLVSAAHDNPKTLCIGVDNFSQHDRYGNNEDILRASIKPYPNVLFMAQDYEIALPQLIRSGLRVGFFFYDGDHTYQHQFDSLVMALPLLTDDAIIMVDDVNWEQVQRANADFCKQYGFQSAFRRLSDRQDDPDWWNGVDILQRLPS